MTENCIRCGSDIVINVQVYKLVKGDLTDHGFVENKKQDSLYMCLDCEELIEG